MSPVATARPDPAPPETLEALTRRVLNMLERLTGMESTYLTRIDHDAGVQQVLFARNSGELCIDEGLTVPWQETLCRRALEEGRYSADDVSDAWPEADVAGELGLKSYLTVPVRLSDGTVYGTLCGVSRDSVRVPAETLELLQVFGSLVASQLDTEARAIEAEHRLRRMLLVAEVGHMCLDADALIPVVAETARLLMRQPIWRRVIPFTLEDGELDFDSDEDASARALVEAIIEAAGERVLRLHDAHNQPLLHAEEASDEIRRLRTALGLSEDGASGLLTATPRVGGLQAGIVVLSNQPFEVEGHNDQMLANCSNYLSLLADRLYHQGVLEASNRELGRQASQDPLTGLANRRSLLEMLERMVASAARGDQQLLVAFVDLDGFKRLNDEHGHEAGDLFLISIARRLLAGLRGDDVVARIGGDEFVIATLAGAHRDRDEIARHLSERIDQAIVGRHSLGSLNLDYTGASIGQVSWRAGESVADLLKRADAAMYDAKRRRSGR